MSICYALILGILALTTAQSEIDPDRSLLESMIKKEQAAQAGAKLTPSERREALVKAIERSALEVGFEVKAKLTGAKKDTLELNSLVFDKPMIYRAVVKGSNDLAGVLRSAAITKVLVTNGKESWVFDTRSPEKWLEVLSTKK